MSDSILGGSASTAPRSRRVAAAIIDLLVIPVILGLVIGLTLLTVPETIRSVLLVLVNIAWLIFRDLVFSPARWMVGLQLESQTGEKVTLAQAFIRNILLIIPFVLVIGYIVELISLLTKGERLGDKWAKTRVIKVA